MTKPSVLVVDDDEAFRSSLGAFLTQRGYEVETAVSGERAIARLRAANQPNVLILDLMMPRVGGLEVLEEMARSRRAVPTIVLSGMGQVTMVVKAMRLGASDYLVKPFADEDLERAVQSALEESQTGAPAPAGAPPREVVSVNPQMMKMRELAAQVADTDVPVLILGESGVGKEVMARHIHYSSARRNEQLLKVNCAALPSELLESELFGYERGAFTGALRDKPGKFELAGRGTIFLDEIGEMSPLLQAKLLHVLQDGEFTRLGGTKPQCSSARVVTATNQRLEECVAEGTFREDLYYRLNVIRIEIPPLRERREDIAPLCTFLINLYSARYKRPAREIPPDLMEAIDNYSWPGNVRQLENIIKRFVILPDVNLALGELVEPEAAHEIPAARAMAAGSAAQTAPVDLPRDNSSLKKLSSLAAERVEREVVLRTLNEVNWNRKLAAKKLSISYKALLNKIKRWQIGAGASSAAG
ncbi:MAG TPA: sigma-54 dependent transcriptional regulator [Bryobacteraceae bacterium]|nr:sigma-54 dependent transcriptional regulator [Bryobacteraceae bacterium]